MQAQSNGASPLIGKMVAVGLLIAFSLLACQSEDKSEPPRPAPTDTSRQPAAYAPPDADDWPMFMGDAHFSGQSPDTQLKPPLRLLWKFKTGGQIHASPVVVGETVYIGSTDGFFYALDAKKWGVKWRFQAGGPIRYAAAVWNNRVYFSARDNRVYALNATTGEKVWEFESSTWMDSAPVAFNGAVYVGAYTRKIYQINAMTGERIDQLNNGRVVIDHVVYACGQGQLQPIAPAHQLELWRGYVPFSYSFPVTANGTVYIGARDNRLHALDTASKEIVWSYETQGYVDAAPAISRGVLYVASLDGYVYAFANVDTNAPEKPEDKHLTGTVAHDDVPVYDESGNTSSVKLYLNDGEHLPVIQQAQGWYQVELPNGGVGWLDESSFGVFNEVDEIGFNAATSAQVRTLALIEGAEYPHWSPDGERIAFFQRNDLSGQYWRANELWLTDKEAGQFRRLHRGIFYNPNLSWSLDGHFLAFEGYDDSKVSYIWVLDWKNLNLTQVVRGDAPAWSPTANRLAFRRWEDGADTVYRINIDKTGLTALARIPIEGRGSAFSYLDPPVWSPDGRLIAFGLDHQHYKSGHARVRIQSADGARVAEIPTQSQRVREISWSADSSTLAYVLGGNPRPDETLDKQLHVTPVNEPTQVSVIKHANPAWSPKGNWLAYMEREDCMGLRWKVWLHNNETNRVLPIARTTLNLTSIAWLPDGKHLCLWHTSEYLRGGEYKPAKTRGWVVELAGLM